MPNVSKKKKKAKAIMLGVGLDSDGHKRVTVNAFSLNSNAFPDESPNTSVITPGLDGLNSYDPISTCVPCRRAGSSSSQADEKTVSSPASIQGEVANSSKFSLARETNSGSVARSPAPEDSPE